MDVSPFLSMSYVPSTLLRPFVFPTSCDATAARSLALSPAFFSESSASANVGGNAALLRVRERLLGDAVRSVQLRVRSCGGHVLEHLDVVLTGHATAHEAVGLHLRGEGAVVRRVLVRAVVALDLQALSLRGQLDVASEACAVRGLVVEDVDAL